MLDHGADARAFETIVATGPNSAVPHHRPTDAVLGRGDFVKIDFGALVGGYHSDMTRTFVLGAAESWQREIYDLACCRSAGRLPGAGKRQALCEVDGSVIAEAGYGEHFGHGLGHGVGLQIHEAPGINLSAAGDAAQRIGGDRRTRRLSAESRRGSHRRHSRCRRRRLRVADAVPQGVDCPVVKPAGGPGKLRTAVIAHYRTLEENDRPWRQLPTSRTASC